MTQEQELICATGAVTTKIGDRFTEVKGGESHEWEIVGFGDPLKRDPDGNPVVICKCLGRMPSWWERYAKPDGTLEWCGDSVAASLLTKEDGRPRNSRGHLLMPTSIR